MKWKFLDHKNLELHVYSITCMYECLIVWTGTRTVASLWGWELQVYHMMHSNINFETDSVSL